MAEISITDDAADPDHGYDPKKSIAVQLAAGLIREFEQGPDGGFAKEPYMCPGGMWTIGWGHAIMDELELTYFKPGIDHGRAESIMYQDLEKAESSLIQLTDADLSPMQQGALISFIFNVGHGNFATSTLLKRLNTNEIEDVPNQLNRWVHAKGEVLPGLVRRRQAEVALGAPW